MEFVLSQELHARSIKAKQASVFVNQVVDTMYVFSRVNAHTHTSVWIQTRIWGVFKYWVQVRATTKGWQFCLLGEGKGGRDEVKMYTKRKGIHHPRANTWRKCIYWSRMVWTQRSHSRWLAACQPYAYSVLPALCPICMLWNASTVPASQPVSV